MWKHLHLAGILFVGRTGAAWSLGELNDTRAIRPLIQALKDEDYMVRVEAEMALGDLNAVDPLILALKDEDGTVRQGAAFTLANLKDPRAIEPLIQALKDENSYVRSAAADALTKLGMAGSIGVGAGVYRLIPTLNSMCNM